MASLVEMKYTLLAVRDLVSTPASIDLDPKSFGVVGCFCVFPSWFPAEKKKLDGKGVLMLSFDPRSVFSPLSQFSYGSVVEIQAWIPKELLFVNNEYVYHI